MALNYEWWQYLQVGVGPSKIIVLLLEAWTCCEAHEVLSHPPQVAIRQLRQRVLAFVAPQHAALHLLAQGVLLVDVEVAELSTGLAAAVEEAAVGAQAAPAVDLGAVIMSQNRLCSNMGSEITMSGT